MSNCVPTFVANCIGFSNDVSDFMYSGVMMDQIDLERISSIIDDTQLPSRLCTNQVESGTTIYSDTLKIPIAFVNNRWQAIDGKRLADRFYEIWSWGANGSGQMGNSCTTLCTVPVAIATTSWDKLAIGGAGGSHSAATKLDGTLWVWGLNSSGQLGDGTTATRLSPVIEITGAKNWESVIPGFAHTIATKKDGTLWTWGLNTCGALGDGTTVNKSSPVTPAGGGTDWCQASASNCFSAAVKTNGTLWTWGLNNFGQLGESTVTPRSSPGTVTGGGSNWCYVQAGTASTVALKTDGTLWTWGCNTNSELGSGDTVSRSSPAQISGGGTTWCKISTGGYHSLAIKSDGTLWTWGFNGNNQLGDGTGSNKPSPITTAYGGTTWCKISTGRRHSLALKTDGTLWAWGLNSSGQIGVGDGTNRRAPTQVCGNRTDWYDVSGGSDHTYAISRNI